MARNVGDYGDLGLNSRALSYAGVVGVWAVEVLEGDARELRDGIPW